MTHHNRRSTIFDLNILQYQLDSLLFGPVACGAEAFIDESWDYDFPRARRVLTRELDEIHYAFDSFLLGDGIGVRDNLLESVGLV